MSVLWFVLAVVALGGAIVVVRALAKVLSAARQLQQHVDILSQQVNTELKRLGGDLAELGESLDEARKK